jgi:chemotaxis protein MotA
MISKGASISSFLDWPSVLIVIGGTIASTVISASFKDLKKLGPAFKMVFQKDENDNLHQEIDRIAEIALTSKKHGMLYLDNLLSNIHDPFMKKGLQLVMDGMDPEYVRNQLETDIYYMQERHCKSQAIVDSMAAFAPAYGMIGTLIGLINMLKSLSNTDALGPSMAVALITTFYGIILANLIFIPISKRLKAITARETLRKELLLEGILAIQVGENPRFIRERLYSFLSGADTKRLGRSNRGGAYAKRT